jgi:hypothetical protein
MTDRLDPRRPNQPEPFADDKSPEEWDEEVVEDLPQGGQQEPMPPS